MGSRIKMFICNQKRNVLTIPGACGQWLQAEAPLIATILCVTIAGLGLLRVAGDHLVGATRTSLDATCPATNTAGMFACDGGSAAHRPTAEIVAGKKSELADREKIAQSWKEKEATLLDEAVNLRPDRIGANNVRKGWLCISTAALIV
eukprot:g13018.t1